MPVQMNHWVQRRQKAKKSIAPCEALYFKYIVHYLILKFLIWSIMHVMTVLLLVSYGRSFYITDHKASMLNDHKS